MAAESIGEAIDPHGRRVKLDAAAVKHIVDEHPEMEAHVAEILHVIARPEVIQLDTWPGRERYFRRGSGPSTWLFAVVDFEAKPPRVVTAYGKRKGP